MSEQFVNFAQNVKTILYNNWDLEDQLEREKIKWYDYEAPRKIVNENKISIILTNPSNTAIPKSKANTRMQELIKIDVYMKMKDPLGELERQQMETNRQKIIDKIYELIHDNQTGITGLEIVPFGRRLRSDELDESAKVFLHDTVYFTGEWFHNS